MPPKNATPVLAPARIPPSGRSPAPTIGDGPDASTSKDQDKGKKKNKEGHSPVKEVMGPPPDPSKPLRILESEMNSLSECLTVRYT